MTTRMIAMGGNIRMASNGRLEGYLVRFTSPDEVDTYGTWFDANTDYMTDDHPIVGTPIYYNHGMDRRIGVNKLATVTDSRIDAKGLWIEAELQQQELYLEWVRELEQKAQQRNGRGLGFSSGAWEQSVRVGDDGHIDRWAIIEGSLTLIPADIKNVVMTFDNLKSAINSNDTDDAPPEAVEPEATMAAPAVTVEVVSYADDDTQINQPMEVIVTDNNEQALTPANPDIEALRSANQALSKRLDEVMSYIEDAPRVARSGYVTVDGGTADPGIRNAGDMLMAIKRNDQKRLGSVYAVRAMAEQDGTTGGYYVPDQVLQDLLGGITLTSGIVNLVTRIPVSGPAGSMPVRDHSRVPTADNGSSASAQGVESQSRGEGASYTEETPRVANIQYRTTDFASGYVSASREIMADVGIIQTMIQQAITEDVSNRIEYGILRGNGVNQPLGVLNWAGNVDHDELTDNTFAVEDADTMLSRLFMRSGQNVAWVHGYNTMPSVAAFERGTGAAALHSNIAGEMPTTLHGYRRFVSQHLPALGTSGYIVLGDWSLYGLFERGGLYIDYSEHARFLNGEGTWRFGKRVDGKPLMTGAITLADGTTTISPFVTVVS